MFINLSDGADGVGGQLLGDKEYPFSGVTSSGRVWPYGWGGPPEPDLVRILYVSAWPYGWSGSEHRFQPVSSKDSMLYSKRMNSIR